MSSIFWTAQARLDLAAIRAFITQDSPNYAAVIVAQRIAATDQLAAFPESGRAVPEFDDPFVREIVRRPYRIVCRSAASDQAHVLTIHHGSQRFPSEL